MNSMLSSRQKTAVLLVAIAWLSDNMGWAQDAEYRLPAITAESQGAKVATPPPEKQEPKSCESIIPWDKIPPVRVIAKSGYFPIAPKGPGYYSLRDMMSCNFREAPPKFPYVPLALMQPSFFDADFRYLDSPKNTQHDFFDPIHRIHLGDNWLASTGGSVWIRHVNDVNGRLSGVDNNYDLTRVRVFGDLWYQDLFRVYVEYIDAQSYSQNLAPLAIDVNRSDLLNAFVDIKLGGCTDCPTYLRVGRQEMLLGSQRLVSTLEWGNTRRTFEGVRAFRTSEKFDVDLFWVSPVPAQPSHFDSHDNNQNFAGLWTTYRPVKGQFLDLYYLFLDNTNNKTQQGIASAPFNVHTVGSRFAGDKNNFLWDVEGMLQFGERGSQDIFAGAAIAGGGYNFASAPLNPTFWLFYEYASGDSSPNGGSRYGTFNQLFAFGHHYLGWLDLVGRQNIHDFSAHMYLYPTNWITFWTQYHHFSLASNTDALYNAAGNAIRRDKTGRAGSSVGDEIDLFLNFHLGPHSDILVGYSKLFPGSFVERTGPSQAPELFYLQYTFRW